MYFTKANRGYLDRLSLELVASLLNVMTSTLASIKKDFSKSKERSRDLEESGRKLELYVNNQQLFRNKDIRLNSIAQKIGLSSHELSVVLDSYFNKGFIDYINQYWVK